MKNNHISRRRIVAATVLACGGTAALFHQTTRNLLNTLLNHIIKSGRSRFLNNKLESQPTRNFVQFNMYGAPTRWHFDHVLRPNDTDGFLQCPGAYNKLTGINSADPHLSKGVYADVKIKGLNMPHLWQYNVAKSDGSARPMADLMDHMLMIRGCKLNTDGHPINCERQVSPIAGDYSITGLAADRSGVCFPAINVGRSPANNAYKSKSGVGAVDIPVDSPDYISYLLEIFQKNELTPNYEAISFDTEQAIKKLEQYSLSNQPGAEILYHERRRSEKMIRTTISNFTEAYKQLISKYEDLYQRTLNLGPIQGVNDTAIPSLKFPCQVTGKADVVTGLGSHCMNNELIINADLRTLYAKIETLHLAKQFALAEFALTEGVGSSIILVSQAHERDDLISGLHDEVEFLNLNQIESKFDEISNKTIFSIKKNATGANKASLHFPTDSHETGWINNIIGCNLFYRSFSSCLLELIDQLKNTRVDGKSLFSETVVQFASEFERYPTSSGGGSQHNITASVTSLFSGIIEKPAVLGNIYVGRHTNLSSTYPNGTLGAAAPIPTLSNKIININNISSTLSEMLRTERIVERAASLVEVKDDVLIPKIELGRNIEDEKPG